MSNHPSLRRTKIVATIGPATASLEMVERLIRAGMDCARINCSHGVREDLIASIRIVREVQERIDHPVAILADLPGPKLRLGTLPQERLIETGSEVVLTTPGTAKPGELELGFTIDFAAVVQIGASVMIDDGRVRLRVVEATSTSCRCEVITGGVVRSQKGVNFPGTYLPIPSITDRDREMLAMAIDQDVDYVALSFVRRAEDVDELRRLIDQAGGRQRVIAKIEKMEAVEKLDSIIDAADGIMVARGDLGVEIGTADVPMAQKRMIARGRAAGKPVITATQMLESMIERPIPTRAEASDVANAILDGTSAVMLSGETAVGEYPVEAVETMVRIAAAVEPSYAYLESSYDDARLGPRFISDVVGHAACDMAEVIEAAALVVPTVSGETAREVSKHRPRRPIVACTPSIGVRQQLMLDWAVVPLLLEPTHDVETLWRRSVDAVLRAGIAGPGDRVVITSGTNVNRKGATNTILVRTL
jgi:pyruvate kinase